jgi:uncharacterized membrane protein (UPF0127 family)
MLRNLIAGFLAAFLLAASPASAETAAVEREELIVSTDSGERAFAVEIADDPRERARGLMFRRHMESGHGMLFDFQEEERASFWMENTYIPLDMLFIKADGTVESIAARTTPLSRRSVESKGPVRYVLEINGGLSRSLGIEPGDKVSGPAIEARQ